MSRLDITMEARRRITELEGPGEDPAMRVAYHHERACWSEWSEFLPANSHVLALDNAETDWRQR